MKIDPSKVNLLEKDIEDWLWENPQAVKLWDRLPVDKWIHRQLKVPSGILDLLGVICFPEYAHLVVVEIKNGPIKADALTQVSRYAADVDEAIKFIIEAPHAKQDLKYDVKKVVIGTDCDDRTFYEAKALGIHTISFNVHFHLSLAGWAWTSEYVERRYNEVKALATDEGLIEFTSNVFEIERLAALRNSPDLGDYDPVAKFEEAIKNALEEKRDNE